MPKDISEMFQDIICGQHFDLSQAHCADKTIILCSGRPKTRARLPGISGVAQIWFFDLRKRNSRIINSCRYLPGRAWRQGARWVPLSGLGLMFSSVQAMNTAGLCRSGRTVMPRPP